jgi:hypothetical protein
MTERSRQPPRNVDVALAGATQQKKGRPDCSERRNGGRGATAYLGKSNIAALAGVSRSIPRESRVLRAPEDSSKPRP